MTAGLKRGRGAAVGVKPGDGSQPACPRCLQFEDELGELQERLMASGQFVAFSPGPNPNLNVERELQRWLSVNPRADAAAGFRAGWTDWRDSLARGSANGRAAGVAPCVTTIA